MSPGSMFTCFWAGQAGIWGQHHGHSQDSVGLSQPLLHFNLIYIQTPSRLRGLCPWKLEGMGGDWSVTVLKVELGFESGARQVS